MRSLGVDSRRDLLGIDHREGWCVRVVVNRAGDHETVAVWTADRRRRREKLLENENEMVSGKWGESRW